MRRLDRLVCRLYLALLHCSRLLARSPPISVSIQATWEEPPLLIQILESAALERPKSYFSFLDAVCSGWTFKASEPVTDQELYEFITRTLASPGLLDGPGEYDSLATSVALKEAHPKIEAFRAWYASLPSNLAHQGPQKKDDLDASINDCESWAYLDGQKICDAARLTEILDSENVVVRRSVLPRILPFDHYHGLLSETSAPTVILYASANPRSFGPLHKVLFKASQQVPPQATYIFRWKVSPENVSSKSHSASYLSGWGAGLDIKKSEYLTLDDRPVESGTSDQTQHVAQSQDQPQVTLGVQSEKSKLTPLKAAEILDIGLKATQHVLSSPDPLAALRNLSQNFPKHAHALVNEWVPGNIPAELREELEKNSEEVISPGRSAVWMNGLELSSVMSLENLNFFKLVEIMRSERRWIISLVSLGLSPVQARTLIADENVNSAVNPDAGTKAEGWEMNASILGERFDASDKQEGGGAIIWWNDLESDARYAGWPSNLRYILRPSFPGQLQAIARNMINVVVALDLSQISSLETLGNIIEPFISRNLPIRWGFVPILPKEPGREELISNSLWNLTDSIGPMETLKFIKQFLQSLESDSVEVDLFSSQATDLILATVDPSQTEEEVSKANQSKEERFKTWLHKAKLYTSRLALCSSDHSISACMLINGRFFPIDDDFRSHLQQTAMLHTQFIQHQVYFDLLGGDTDVASYLYDLPLVHSSRNDFVIPSDTRPLRFSNMMDALDDAKNTSAQVFFGNEATSESEKAQSLALIWLVGNLDSEGGVAAVAAVLGLLMRPLPEVSVRVAFVHTPTGKNNGPTDMSTALAALLRSTSGSKISCKDVLAEVRRHGFDVRALEANAQKVADETAELFLVKSSLGESETIKAANAIWSGAKAFSDSLGIKSDELAIVINGRVLNVSPSQRLTSNDLSMLVEYENEKRTSPLTKALQQLDGYDLLSQQSKIPMISSVVGSVLVSSDDGPFQMASNEGRSASYRSRNGNHSSLQLGDAKKALFDFGVILNPAGEAAQGWSALLEVLSRRSDVVMKVWLNPSLEVNELPIKRFFRTSIANCLEFDNDGHVISPGVTFQDIPPETLLTLAIDTPPAWLALSQDSVHDLDNIMLSELPSAHGTQGVEAVFQLEHIIIAGHAREVPSEMPPRGLQIVLKDLLRDREVDTIIMANLGYFQFKSAPGLHRLTIRPGRSSELYEIETVHATTQKAGETADVKTSGDEEQIFLTTFNGLTLFPRFRKRPEKMDESLIQPITAESSSSSAGAASELTKLVGQVKDIATGVFGNKVVDAIKGRPVQAINIFTVASGLLYERMAYLMCVSVMRHTKSPVKFWFISNFLSPSFKRFIPHLAREYGFDYQLVTYRWPPWLRAQKEKQRVIWGYKILFLDVLFPLEIDRVIFVDSDQVVRTDLKALVDLDLRGAPYAYAPMCNDRNETKGFRFWDTGYWKDSLQGRPYHISALYVVDLRVFRAIAAGDQLRQHYQALSADPGSLANLDQDLPNNMQSALPIFTLDQSWLWCETWCSDEGLKVAKTIDLCNNPLTHEPKLKRARRLIPEWDVYDQEVAALAARVKRDNQDQLAAKITVQAGETIGDDNRPKQHEDDHRKDEL